jgi:cysteine desulfuration protein SufE
MSAKSGVIDGLIEDFQGLETRDRLMLLLEFSENLPELPARYAEHPDLLERVDECQAPIFLFVEIDESNTAHLFFAAPLEAPTTRGFASILHEVLDGLPAKELLDIDDDFPSRLGLSEAVSPLRMNGMRAMLRRIKRQVREKIAAD